MVVTKHTNQGYLSPEGLEFMAHSMSSLAAIESSTLLTSLVKLPSTCLLLGATAATLLCVSDLGTYTAARYHVHARVCVRDKKLSPPPRRFPFLALLDWSLISAIK